MLAPLKRSFLATVAVFATISLVTPASASSDTNSSGVASATEFQALPEVVRMDLRTHIEERAHSITISAKKYEGERFGGDDVGHAFITFNKEDDRKAMTTNEVVGFYPPLGEDKTLWRPIFGSYEGGLHDDSRHDADLKLVVSVNADQYQRALAVYEKYKQQSQNYVLTINDCTTFAGEVARAIGLPTPTRLIAPYPIDYVKEIIQLKKDSDAAEKEKAERLKQEEQRKQEERRKLDQQRAAAAAAMMWQQQQAAAAAAAAAQQAAQQQAAEAARQQMAQQAAQAAAAEAARQAAARAAAEKAAADAAAARAAQSARQAQAQQEAWLASLKAQQAADAARAAQMAPKYPYNAGPIGGGGYGGGAGAGTGGPVIGPMR